MSLKQFAGKASVSHLLSLRFVRLAGRAGLYRAELFGWGRAVGLHCLAHAAQRATRHPFLCFVLLMRCVEALQRQAFTPFLFDWTYIEAQI